MQLSVKVTYDGNAQFSHNILLCRPLRKAERNILHVNLAVALLAAQVLFLVGIDKTKYRVSKVSQFHRCCIFHKFTEIVSRRRFPLCFSFSLLIC